jgi:hypothetical protein
MYRAADALLLYYDFPQVLPDPIRRRHPDRWGDDRNRLGIPFAPEMPRSWNR